MSDAPKNLTEVIIAVLREAGEPMHYRDIATRVVERGAWAGRRGDPAFGVNATLSDSLQSPESPFERAARGIYALRPGRPLSDPSSPVAKKTLSLTDAAEQVLEQFGNKSPMHYRAITEKALELGLVTTSAQEPTLSLYAAIASEMDRQASRGDVPRFFRQGRGYFGLSEWMGRGLAREIEEHNREVRKRLRERLLDMKPADFEVLVGQLLVALGFAEVTVTGRSGDGGIDVRGTLVVGDVIRTTMAVQVKRWQSNVQAPTVQQVRGSLGAHERGLIITTAGFSSGARQEAAQSDRAPVALMDGEQLVALLVKHDIGVRRASYDLIELGEETTVPT